MGFTKELNTRLRLKVDTLEHWNKSTLGLLEGEIAIATVAATEGTGLAEPVVMIKVGQPAVDGVHKTFSQLPWNLHAKASDVLAACKTEAGLTKFIKDAISTEGAYAAKEHKHNTADINGLETYTDNRIDAFWKADITGGKAYVDKVSGDIQAAVLEIIGTADDAATADTIYGAIANCLKNAKAYTDAEIQKLDYTDIAVAGEYIETVSQLDGKISVTRKALPTYTLVTGDDNGQVKFNGTNVDVKGLGSAAYQNVDAFDAKDSAKNAKAEVIGTSGDASTANTVHGAKKYADEKVNDLETGAVATNATAIENITKADGLIATAKSEAIADAAGKVNALKNGDVKANADAIAAINHAETGVLAQAKAYVDSEDVFHTDITTVNALGGIAAGADLDGMTTHEILNTLLFPYVAFVLGSTSRSAAAATLENGATQTLSSASISITKKSKPITSVKLLNGSTVLGEKTGDDVAAGGTITFSNLGITVSKSNNPNLKFTVTDGTTSTDKNVGASTFVYPYYMGECAADATIDETLIEGLTKKVESKGNKTVTHTCENGRMVIAYPKAHGVLKSILDPNNFETIGDYTRSEVSVTGLDGTAQTYYVYASGAATVSGFKVQYKY